MAAIHKLEIETSLLRTGALSPAVIEELFRTVDESISYELEVGSGVTDTNLPGFGSGDTQITTIQTFILITDTTVVLNWNGADTTLSVGTSERRAIFIAYGVSTSTVPHLTNSGSTTAIVTVVAGGT